MRNDFTVTPGLQYECEPKEVPAKDARHPEPRMAAASAWTEWSARHAEDDTVNRLSVDYANPPIYHNLPWYRLGNHSTRSRKEHD
ncbi:hypothetical protein [Parasedimentitalea psychrophila]|uniref:Uncharacterized protein n=1 Tax=Parasedimentitalea psychrophila TaxID=2997337 RepID=A0A9Y2L4Z2_9RHOB|nr:hypothetical protein [Parasedimentitalea psychrophila]WIY27702.1 hypothetical protein QPJ95_05520 [Parasedimentitalea psychrophila]